MRKPALAAALVVATGLASFAMVDRFTPVAYAFGADSTPFSGGPSPIPGTIQAEDFDWGGPGVAYSDTTPGNTGGAYRTTEDVDIAELSDGKIVVGWLDAGEWLNYTVNVATSGSYSVGFRVACVGRGGTFHLAMNGVDVTGAISVPDTGGWDTWTTITRTVNLAEGPQVATLVMDSLGDGAVGNFDWMEFTSPSSGAGDTFRMMTWNIDQGFSDDDQTFRTLPYQIDYMANSGADVIVLQEVSVWDEDQPTLYRTGLEQATGQTWYSQWAPGGDCVTGGGCIGVQILTRFPIAASQSIFVPVGDDRSSVAEALIYVAGVPIDIFTNHLEYWDTGIRTAELLGLMGFAQSLGGARLVAGDFNSWWDEWWIHQMETEYSDTKVDITQNQDGDYTIGNVRFDYIFRSYDQAWRLTPVNCMVGWDADWMSDHRPVIADFRVQ